MKKLLLSLFVAGALTFGLQSCGEDEPPTDPCDGVTCAAGETCVNGTCETTVVTCDVCGVYNGEADGGIAITLLTIDTTFTNLPLSSTITANAAAGSYNMAVDISSLLGSPAGTLVPDVDGTLAGDTISIVGQNYNYQQIASIDIDGSVGFNAGRTALTGVLYLTGAAVGTVTFDGTKQ